MAGYDIIERRPWRLYEDIEAYWFVHPSRRHREATAAL
jgi:hypothetical protein